MYDFFRVLLSISFIPCTFFLFLLSSLRNLLSVNVQQSLYRPITSPEGSEGSRFRDLKQIDTWKCQTYAPATINPQEIFLVLIFIPGSSVGIASDYGLDGPGSNPGGDEIFRPSRPGLGPTRPPVKWVPCPYRGVKCGRGVLLTTQPLLVPRS